MRQVTRQGLLTAAAASGFLAMSGGAAFADSDAAGAAAGSPGVASGNTVQIPVNVPVNVCGNTINVVGLLNPAYGNNCENRGPGSSAHDGTADGHRQGEPSGGGTQTPDASGSGGGAQAHGVAAGSPGVASGNEVQAPIDVPLNLCGNAISIVGLGNSATANECENEAGQPERPAPHQPPAPHEEPPAEPDSPQPDTPVAQEEPAPAEPEAEEPTEGGALAETGSELPLAGLVTAGAGLLAGGAVLYRRARVPRQR